MALQSAIINVMEKAVKKASIRLVRDFNEVEHLQVSRKGPADFVSRADIRTERKIVEELKEARPGYGFILEEGENIASEDANNSTWIIDPIDGTTNFLHSIPHFAISVALEKDGEIVAGIVYNPITDEFFWAEKGRGAFVGNRKLTVSSRKNLADCVLATGIPFMGKPNLATFPAQINTIMPKVAGIRRFGSAALDLAFVAAGRFDGFWEENLQPWDIAAGILIVREARGMVSEFDGRAKVMETGQILATNGAIHGSVTRLLAEARKINRAKQQ